MPEYTVPNTAVADEKYCSNKHTAADGAWLPLQEESSQIQHQKHGMVVYEGWT